MAKNYWIVKQEPGSYPWEQFVQDKTTAWTGVRNYQARNHLRSMKKGDAVLYYHSGEAREVVGLARVVRSPYPDPTAKEGDWTAVDLAAVKPLKKPVALSTFRDDPILNEMPLLRQSRLSVGPLSEAQFRRVLELALTKP
jgi:predicted RNA-binding protein with PUA-like domain